MRSNYLLFIFILSVALSAADLIVFSAQDDQTRVGQTIFYVNIRGGNTNIMRRRGRHPRSRGNNANTGNMSGKVNANLSPDMQNINANAAESAADQASMMSNSERMGKGRRGGAMNANMAGDMSSNANADTSGAMQANTNASGASLRTRHSGRCDNTQQEQTDLSGTYTGNVNYPDGGLTGDGTLTITGNNFTFASGTQNITGRVVATTTCGYTAAAMMLGEPTVSTPGQPAPHPPTSVSVRVRRSGGGLSLTPVPGAMHSFSFTSDGGGRIPSGEATDNPPRRRKFRRHRRRISRGHRRPQPQ